MQNHSTRLLLNVILVSRKSMWNQCCNVNHVSRCKNPPFHIWQETIMAFHGSRKRGRCWEYSWDDKLSILFVLHEELFCFEGRIELSIRTYASAVSTSWSIELFVQFLIDAQKSVVYKRIIYLYNIIDLFEKWLLFNYSFICI